MEQTQGLEDLQVTLPNQLDSRKKCVVYIKNLVKSYNNGPPTLKHLNMTVNQGIIYSLLGSSGCGKTTLLSCIVGLQTWNSGELLVFGQRPGKQLATKIGYMPQDLSLYHQLSTYETIQFYGKLYKLSMQKLEEKWQFLKVLLQLPSKSKLIGDMSGGQRKRASLALALIHSPELLILDEPTVGLDPLLRERIWNHLNTIVKTMNTTIILTTHYIEEARFCDTTGILRNGQIIAETSPSSLLQKYNCDLLEDAVLKLCHDNELHDTNQVPNKPVITSFGNWFKNPSTYSNPAVVLSHRKVEIIDSETSNISQIHDTKTLEALSGSWRSDMHHSFERISGLILVMALTFIRHPVFLALCMIMPTIQSCLILGSIGYRVQYLHFGVVNNDIPDWETKCVAQKILQNPCDLISISCGFIDRLQEDDLLILVRANTLPNTNFFE